MQDEVISDTNETNVPEEVTDVTESDLKDKVDKLFNGGMEVDDFGGRSFDELRDQLERLTNMIEDLKSGMKRGRGKKKKRSLARKKK